jgi:hypothetical protein
MTTLPCGIMARVQGQQQHFRLAASMLTRDRVNRVAFAKRSNRGPPSSEVMGTHLTMVLRVVLHRSSTHRTWLMASRLRRLTRAGNISTPTEPYTPVIVVSLLLRDKFRACILTGCRVSRAWTSWACARVLRVQAYNSSRVRFNMLRVLSNWCRVISFYSELCGGVVL